MYVRIESEGTDTGASVVESSVLLFDNGRPLPDMIDSKLA